MINLFNRPLPQRLPWLDARESAEVLLKDALARADPSVADITAHLSAAAGKGIRSRLLLICAADDELFVPDNAVYSAVAVELFHLATLVHDDVIDDAPTRRGRESVQSRYGKKSAVIIGDYLLCLAAAAAAHVLNSNAEGQARQAERLLSLTREYLPAVANICLGEFRQLRESANLDLSPRLYLKIIAGKTAELFRLSAIIGAEAGGAGEDAVKRAGKFGLYLGMVFQIIDDCKDYLSSEVSVQKPVRHDLAQGVVTLPLILALINAPELRGTAQAALFRGEAGAALAGLVARAGGVERARGIAQRYAQKGEKLAAELYTGPKREKLLDLLQNALKGS
ncbi:MAG: polyprenyl synthetase family protein [Clostridiales bacterium]|jgi:heptaprenyl diphosphate synthase|nr:polyprenyl synthetase family protein [Clostridiales bacterium]